MFSEERSLQSHLFVPKCNENSMLNTNVHYTAVIYQALLTYQQHKFAGVLIVDNQL